MIAHLRGRVAHRTATSLVVDVGGVGYLVHVPATTAQRLPARGEPVELHTSLQVREDAMTLYGFVDDDARGVFELLLEASGVGPKLALAALSTHPPSALREAISRDDVEALTLVPGIGRKSAQKLVFELRERVGGEPGDAVPAVAGSTPDALGEVREALAQLGYSAGEIAQVTATLDGDAPGDTGALLRQALQQLGAGTVTG